MILPLAACSGGTSFGDLSANETARLRTPCDALPAPAYAPTATWEQALTVDVIDCNLALPSRLRLSPDGQWLFLTQLRGTTYVYQRQTEGWDFQEASFFDLGDLGVVNEAGLTSIALAPGFDPESPERSRREVFLSYQTRTDNGNVNRISRVVAGMDAGNLVGTDPEVIWTGTGPTGDAHQVQDVHAFEMRGRAHLLALVGDGNEPSSAADPSTDAGSVVLMQRDGSDPLGARAWPDFPKRQAIGVRNAYSMVMLAPEVDPRQGIVAVENGNSSNDRAWLKRLVDIEGARALPHDLGYRGSDTEASFTQTPDISSVGGVGQARNSVFRLFSPPVAPTGLALHPGGGPIAPSDVSGASLVVGLFGETGATEVNERNGLGYLRVTNIGGAALQSTFELMLARRPETAGAVHHPVAVEVDPSDGTTYFADIITGSLYRVGLVR